MKRSSCIIFILVTLVCGRGWTQETESSPSESWWRKNFRYSGELRQETAYRIASPRNFSKIKQFAKLDLKFTFNDHLKLKLGGRAYYDAVYELTDQYPIPVRNDMRQEVDLRDAYLDISASKVNIRLGHQQVVWGEALGQFFADVVVPKDLREFFLPDFEEIRLPIWALDIQYNFVPNATLEVVVSPDQRVDRLAPPGADFAFFVPPPPPGVEQVLLPDEGLDTDLKHWNAGARISYLVKGWDLAWLYYTSPVHEPALFKTMSVNSETGVPQLIFDPEHRRVHQIGMTFSKDIRKSVIRGEFVYTLGRFFDAEEITAQNQGVLKKGQLRYVLGFDASLGGRVDMNAEFQQAAVFASDAELAFPILQSWIFLRFETGFFHEKLVPEMIFIVGIIDGDTQISPRLHYNVTDSVRLTWGMDVWTGPLETLYGEFQNSNRVFMNTSWKF